MGENAELIGSMGWLKGKSTGNQRFSHDIWDFPVIFPLNQSNDWWFQLLWKIWKSVWMIIPHIWENKTCSKPPSSEVSAIWLQPAMEFLGFDFMILRVDPKQDEMPRSSMYGIFTYIWVIYGVNVGKYTIHGWSGMEHDQGNCGAPWWAVQAKLADFQIREQVF